MKYLAIVDAALFAIAATIALVLAVVCLLYGLNADVSPRVASEMPALSTATLTFIGLAFVLGLAFWTVVRRRTGLWSAQALAAVSLVVGSMILFRLFTP